MNELQIRKIVAGYDGVPVLSGVSFNVAHGELAAVLGPSGSGKSTLLRVIAGLVHPLEGAVVLDGRVLSGPRVNVPPEKRSVALVPQDAALFPHLDVLANTSFGLPRAQRGGARARDLLEMVGLSDFAHRMPGELSGGELHRVALARALATDPQVVLLDEPFSALDAALRIELRAHVKRVLRHAGVTALLVTHDQEEALSMADLVAVVDGGRLVQVGTPAQIYAAPSSRWLAKFVGGAMVVPGTWRRGIVAGPLGSVQARLAAGELAQDGDAVDLVVRPEQIHVSDFSQSSQPGVVAMVREVSYFGHDSVIVLDVPGWPEPIEARVLGDHHWERDTEVHVNVKSEAIAFAASR
jgi:iron(III) transport system ATP-binding protein